MAVDSIGMPGDLTVEIAKMLKEKHGLSAMISSLRGTHSHTAPQLSRGLDNLYTVPQSPKRGPDRRLYSAVRDRVVAAVSQAIENLAPAKLTVNTGAAEFAKNRRGLKDGKWVGFSVQAGGVVDHTVPCLRISSLRGRSARCCFNYACHCTTLGGNYNRVNGDWAGYAAAELEAAHPGMLAFSVIGCGADANPDHPTPDQVESSRINGRQLAAAVEKQLTAPGIDLSSSLQSRLASRGSPPKRPRPRHSQAVAEPSPGSSSCRDMLATLARMGATARDLPDADPCLAVWRSVRDGLHGR